MENVSGFDPKRRLCPDGTCTGIIGTDGRCGECGRSSGAANPRDAAGKADGMTEGNGSDIFAVLDAADEASAFAAGPPPRVELGATAGSTGFDPDRRLCEDGTCVGIIGPNGACTVCGRLAG